MKQNKNTLVKDAVILCLITLIASLLVAFSHELTKGPIEANELATKVKAFQVLFPEGNSFDEVEETDLQAVYDAAEESAGKDYGKIVIKDALSVTDSSGSHLGYIVDLVTKEGYGGDIEITVGITPEGIVTGVEILSIGETAGLGMNAKEESFRAQYVGKDVEEYTVTKMEPKEDAEIQAISSATITTRAMTKAVNAAKLLAGVLEGGVN